MKIYFLGTNGWYDTQTGNTNCALIDSKEAYIILDAGNGLYKVSKYIKEKKPIYLFLGHLHLDHIEGIHILNSFRFKQTLNIYSYKGMTRHLNIFVNHPFTVPFSELPFPVKLNELEEGDHQIPFPVTAKKLFHADMCLGYRFNLEGKIITYCVDTGICKNDFELSRNADILIHECSLKESTQPNVWGHTGPEEAAELAKKAHVKKLVLTHFSGDIFLTQKERDNTVAKGQKILKETIGAKDGLIIEV